MTPGSGYDKEVNRSYGSVLRLPYPGCKLSTVTKLLFCLSLHCARTQCDCDSGSGSIRIGWFFKQLVYVLFGWLYTCIKTWHTINSELAILDPARLYINFFRFLNHLLVLTILFTKLNIKHNLFLFYCKSSCLNIVPHVVVNTASVVNISLMWLHCFFWFLA